MLTLTRREGETIIISGGISVTIKAIKGRQVKLEIQAPDHIEILRAELVERDNDQDD